MRDEQRRRVITENPRRPHCGFPPCDRISPAIGSAARKGGTVARRRFQRGSVHQNKARTVWLGWYSEYVLDSNGVEKRRRKQVVLGPIRKTDGVMTKRE